MRSLELKKQSSCFVHLVNKFDEYVVLKAVKFSIADVFNILDAH
jgi:hypothetical protein